MPYACEVYPTFRFDLNIKHPEVAPQPTSLEELRKIRGNLPNAPEDSDFLGSDNPEHLEME